MLKLPDNIMQLSTSSQIQWLILGLGSFYLLIFIVMAGLSYIGPNLGLAENTMQEVAWMSLVVFIFYVYKHYREFKKDLNQLKQLKASQELIDEIKTNIEGEIREDGKRQKIIKIEVNNKIQSILVVYAQVEGVKDDDIIERIIDEAFDGMTLESTRKHKKRD